MISTLTEETNEEIDLTNFIQPPSIKLSSTLSVSKTLFKNNKFILTPFFDSNDKNTKYSKIENIDYFMNIDKAFENLKKSGMEIILIENNILSAANQIDQVVHITDFYNNKFDASLSDLSEYLDELIIVKSETGMSFQEQLAEHFCYGSILKAISND